MISMKGKYLHPPTVIMRYMIRAVVRTVLARERHVLDVDSILKNAKV